MAMKPLSIKRVFGGLGQVVLITGGRIGVDGTQEVVMAVMVITEVGVEDIPIIGVLVADLGAVVEEEEIAAVVV